MPQLNYLAILTAAIAAFVIGALWYSPLLFANAWLKLRGIDPASVAGMKPPIGKLVAEFFRGLIIAFVLARLVIATGVTDWTGALQLGLWVGLGLQVVWLLGSVIHENLPWKLYAIHAGDALVKTLVMTAILGAWR